MILWVPLNFCNKLFNTYFFNLGLIVHACWMCDRLLISFILLWRVTCCHILLFHINTCKLVGIIHSHPLWVFLDMLTTAFIKLKTYYRFCSTCMYLAPCLILIEIRHVFMWKLIKFFLLQPLYNGHTRYLLIKTLKLNTLNQTTP